MEVWQASETSHSKNSLGNFQHQYQAELLVNVYSYHLIVKSVSCCCVCGSRLFQIQSQFFWIMWSVFWRIQNLVSYIFQSILKFYLLYHLSFYCTPHQLFFCVAITVEEHTHRKWLNCTLLIKAWNFAHIIYHVKFILRYKAIVDLTFGDLSGQSYMCEILFLPVCSLNVTQNYLNGIPN